MVFNFQKNYGIFFHIKEEIKKFYIRLMRNLKL